MGHSRGRRGLPGAYELGRLYGGQGETRFGIAAAGLRSNCAMPFNEKSGSAMTCSQLASDCKADSSSTNYLDWIRPSLQNGSKDRYH